ncbi:23995_t:CDS:2, partial [Cetraspora pellucida]
NFLQIITNNDNEYLWQRKHLSKNKRAGLTCDQKCMLLYNVQQPFEVLMTEFDDEWWPLVTNIWVKFSHKTLVNGNSWKTFKTKVREADLCHAKIKVSWFVVEQKVCVERFPGSSDHAHDLNESDKLKRSQAVRVLVEKEAMKNYPTPAIELKWREVANIKYKVRGPQNTYLIGASKLAPDIQDAISFLKKEGYQ